MYRIFKETFKENRKYFISRYILQNIEYYNKDLFLKENTVHLNPRFIAILN